jgi:myosin I
VEDRSEPFILYNLGNRFYKNRIYSRVGKILITINPYKQIALYTQDVIEKIKSDTCNLMPPHVYEISKSALLQFNKHNLSQAIIISGESGAGKTEASKQCLQVSIQELIIN